MLSLLAMNFHAARLGFEAQNAMAFRFLRLVSDTNKPAPLEGEDEVARPPAIQAPAAKVASASARHGSARKVHKKTTKGAKKKIAKRSK
jgi:hypothetical protein